MPASHGCAQYFDSITLLDSIDWSLSLLCAQEGAARHLAQTLLLPLVYLPVAESWRSVTREVKAQPLEFK